MDQSPSYKWVVLIVSTISSFLTPFMGSAITIALPPIAKEFGADAVTQSWIVTSFLLAAGIFLVPFGRVADIYGRKKIYLSGVIIFTIASLFCALATSNPILILFRIIQGLGNAMVFATGMAILISVFPPRNRGKVIGINIAATYIGLSSGPILGGILTEAFTWRSVFWINVPLGLIIIALVSICLKGDWAEAQGDKFDLTGACFYGASILGLMLGIATLPGLKGVGLTCLGMVLMGLFIYRESRIAFPVFDLNLFKTNKVFAFSNLAALINYSATFALSFWLSLYFQNLKGLTPTQTGLILLSQPVIMALFSPLAGLLSDRKEPRLLATLGMIITTLGLLLFAFLKMDTPPAFVVVNLILIGFGFALFSSPNTNAVMSCIEKRHYSIASGSLGTMRLLGMTISMGISTMILSIYLGSVRITPEYFATFIKGIRAAFMIFSLLCFGGIFASGIRGKMHNNADEAPLTDTPCA